MGHFGVFPTVACTSTYNSTHTKTPKKLQNKQTLALDSATFAFTLHYITGLIHQYGCVCCQSSAGSTILSTEFLRTSGLLCCWFDDVELSTETFAWSCSHHLCLCTITRDIFVFRVLSYTAH